MNCVFNAAPFAKPGVPEPATLSRKGPSVNEPVAEAPAKATLRPTRASTGTVVSRRVALAELTEAAAVPNRTTFSEATGLNPVPEITTARPARAVEGLAAAMVSGTACSVSWRTDRDPEAPESRTRVVNDAEASVVTGTEKLSVAVPGGCGQFATSSASLARIDGLAPAIVSNATSRLRGLPVRFTPASSSSPDVPAVSAAGSSVRPRYRRMGAGRAWMVRATVRASPGVIEVVATDGYRLAWRTWDTASQGSFRVIVAARTMNEVSRLVAGTEAEQLTLALARNQVLVTLADRYMTLRTIDGNFPQYRQIIPASFGHEILLDRALFQEAVERITIMASEREGKVINLRFETGQLVLQAQTTDRGEAEESLPIDHEGESIGIAFNGGFLLDALKALEGETVRFQVSGPLQPACIESLEDPTYHCLLMPIRS